jgi:hypothetical protein
VGETDATAAGRLTARSGQSDDYDGGKAEDAEENNAVILSEANSVRDSK